MVEFAIAAPVLMLILFGIIEFSTAFNDYVSLRNGTREAARQAVVASFGPNTTCTLTGASAASTETQRLMCLTKERVAVGAPADMRVRVTFTGNSNAGYGVGQPVIVCSEYPVRSFTGFMQPFIGGKVLKTKVIMRVEQTSPTSGANRFAMGAETPISGSWSWCG